jgi:hypothetical protein
MPRMAKTNKQESKLLEQVLFLTADKLRKKYRCY